MTTHPPDPSGGDTDHEGVVRDVAGDDGARADEGVSADGDAADDGGVGADGAAAAEEGLFVQAVTVDLGAGVGDVGKHAGGAEEDEVFDHSAGVNGYVVLNLDRVAENHVVGDVDVLAEDTVLPYMRARLHVREVPDPAAVTNLTSVVNIGRLVLEVTHNADPFTKNGWRPSGAISTAWWRSPPTNSMEGRASSMPKPQPARVTS